MKKLALFLSILYAGILNGQEVPTLTPSIGKMLDFDGTTKQEWAIRDNALNDLSEGTRSWEELTKEELASIDKHREVFEDMWDIVGSGCSWYCGG